MITMSVLDYLPTLTPDYDDTTLVLSPQDVVVTQAGFTQSQGKTDSGRVKTATLNAPPSVSVSLVWAIVNGDDKTAIYEMYYNTSKGFGLSRSFPWRDPETLADYVAKFASQTRESLFSWDGSGFSVDLIVLGKL